MKAYWISKTAGGTALEPRETPMPQPAPGHLLVRMRAASLNRGDMMARIHRHGAAAARPAGVDGSGEVIEPGGSEFKRGERILFRAHACFAEYAAVDPALAARVPDHWSWEEAAAVPAAYITAWEAVVEFGRMRAGDWVLLAGASSGVGVAALQIAKFLGGRVIGTSGSPHKLATLKTLGMDVGIAARGSAFAQEALAASGGKGVDVAVNLVGGTAFAGCVQCAADFGRVIIVGYVDNEMHADFDLEAVHGRRLQIAGISNTPLTPAQRRLSHQGCMRDLYPAFVSGAIKPVIDRVFGFNALADAKAYLETNQLLGKVVVHIP